MKRFLAGIALCLIPTYACANDSGLTTYAEIGVGASFIPTVSTKTYTLTDGADVAVGRIDLDYDTGLTFGGEIGLARVGIPELRLALGYDFVQARFSSGLVTGMLNGVPGSLAFTRSDLTTIGIDLDNSVHVITGNVSYDLPSWGVLTPYIGAGVGAAIIQHANTQLALTATAGARFTIDKNAYVAIRYRFYDIGNPTDEFGIRYETITNHSIMVVFGMQG
jgi:opacity protein-like surface antigen